MLIRWEDIGAQRFSDGVIALGGEPYNLPQNWQHIIFPPLPCEEQEAHAQKFHRSSEFQFFEQLKHFNGLDLFKSRIFLYGFYAGMEHMTSGHMVWDVYDANLEKHRSFGAPYDAIVIGGAELAKNEFVISQRTDGSILAINYCETRVEFEWQDFDQYLASEIMRVDALINDDGGEVDPGQLDKFKII